MSENSAASPKGHGKRLRWARNVIKGWEGNTPDDGSLRALGQNASIRSEIAKQRYERACALILAQKLAE